MPKTKVYVEAIPLAKERPSGIGHLLLALLGALSELPAFQEKYDLVLFAPHNMYKRINTAGIQHAKTRSLLYPAARVVNGLNYYGLLPPVDLLLGKGIYLFGNFSNYPVSRTSRSVTWVHDLCYERFPETVSPKLQQHLHKHVPTWVKRAHKVVAISEFGKQELEQFYGLSPDKVVLVPGGIDTKLFYRRPDAEVTKVLQKYSLPKDYILFVGNIEPRKNLAVLAQAFGALPADVLKKYSLVLVGGDGWNNEAIYAEIEKARGKGANIVLPKAYIPDESMPALMSGAAYLVSPALYEGFGLTPLEALACGTNVLVSDIPPLHEVVGTFGDYVSPTDTAHLTAALAAKCTAPTRITAQTSPWVEQFSWHHAAGRLLALLDSLSGTM